jgi:hypothetical protein
MRIKKLINFYHYTVPMTQCLTQVVLQLGRLVAGFPTRRPGFEPRSGHVGFVVGKWHWGMFFPSTSVSPANSQSTDCFTVIIYQPVLVQ